MKPACVHLSLLVLLGLPLLLSLNGCGAPRGTATLVVLPAPPWRGLPLRPRTAAGIPGDPINLGVEGSRAALLAAFQKGAWVPADPLSPHNDARLALDFVLHRSYPRAPVSRLYLFGRPEDLALEHELGAVSRRDHVRFWDTRRWDPQTHLELWIGDASRDTVLKSCGRMGFCLVPHTTSAPSWTPSAAGLWRPCAGPESSLPW